MKKCLMILVLTFLYLPNKAVSEELKPLQNYEPIDNEYLMTRCMSLYHVLWGHHGFYNIINGKDNEKIGFNYQEISEMFGIFAASEARENNKKLDRQESYKQAGKNGAKIGIIYDKRMKDNRDSTGHYFNNDNLIIGDIKICHDYLSPIYNHRGLKVLQYPPDYPVN